MQLNRIWPIGSVIWTVNKVKLGLTIILLFYFEIRSKNRYKKLITKAVPRRIIRILTNDYNTSNVIERK